jgi:choice-of-anchor B domain-containing protein
MRMYQSSRVLATFAALLTAAPLVAAPRHAGECVDGVVEGYACNNVDLLGHLDLVALGTSASGNGNDMWGWRDPDTGKEYALVGLNNGTAFVDISDPQNPVRLGNLATHSVNSTWRDIKTIGHYAVIVSEAQDHGMQIFDLHRLRDVTTPPVTFTEDAWYGNFGRAHDIVVNEASGYAFAVGSRQGTQQCNAGLHMINMQNPLVPVFAGCFSADGYTHDAQCITYDGPDSDYTGHEVCFAANEDTLTIVDVTNKASPVQISRTGYTGVGYTHQGWLSEDRRYMLVDDELDEQNTGNNTRTYVWNLQDLDSPQLDFSYLGPTKAIDHNLYIHEGYAYESNYQAGLRILDLSEIDNNILTEAGFFDTHPESDSANFEGTWSNYPFFASGVVGVSDINRGLFVLQPELCRAPEPADGMSAVANGDNRIDLSWNPTTTPGASYAVDRILGGCGGSAVETIVSGLSGTSFSDTMASGTVNYGYRVRSVAASGQCSAAATACVEASTSGACTAPPAFDGLASLQSAGSESCALDLAWQSAQSYCGNGVSYSIYRSQDPAFVPGPDNQIAASLATLSWSDTAVGSGLDYTYVVRSADSGNASIDSNAVRLSAHAAGPVSDGDYFSGAESGSPTLTGVEGGSATSSPLAPTHVAWDIVDSVAHSGDRSYFSGYNNSECLSIGTGSIQLSAGQTSMLEFWTRYGIEAGYDGGVVQISTNGGQDWTTIAPIGGYPNTFNNNNGNACGFANGSGAYSSSNSVNLNWSLQQFDLAAYSGQNVMLRWSFSTDQNLTVDGWWIDDIRVTHAQVPGMCMSGNDLIFVNGFESP